MDAHHLGSWRAGLGWRRDDGIQAELEARFGLRAGLGFDFHRSDIGDQCHRSMISVG